MATTSGLNTLEFRSQLTNELDKALVQKSVTSAFLDNGFASKFVGTKTVLIPDISFVGLGEYDRAEGFPEGGITVDHKPYTLEQERGRRFYFDREDYDEVGIAGLSGQVMGEFVRTKVAPEVDAYCLSKLATLASKNDPVTGDEANGSYAILSDAIKKAQDAAGYDEELIALCDSEFYANLMKTPELTRSINIDNFKKGEISTKIRKLDECWLMPVPASRMQTAFTFLDGVKGTDGAEGGFEPRRADAEKGIEAAKSVGCIVLPKKVAKLVKKLEKIRVFNPDTVQQKDAWQFDYRIYYDMFVKNSELGTIFAYIREA